MATGRRRGRRNALFLLYQHDLMQRPLTEEDLQSLDEFTARIARGVDMRREGLDLIIGAHLEGWDLSRLGYLERNILRIAAYELTVEKDTPAAVVLSEAVELAKRYCSEEGRVLVNGVLGSLAKGLQENTGTP